MTDKKSIDSRRKLLKSIAAGSGAVVAGKALPEAWSKPIVNSIVLPVHAEMTTDDLPVETVCCEGVACNFYFTDTPTNTTIELGSDCSISMSGTGIGLGEYSGNGTVAADGSFSFMVTYATDKTLLVEGTVSADCSNISGTMDDRGPFSGPITLGITADQCPSDE